MPHDPRFLATAIDIVLRAGEIQLAQFQRGHAVTKKGTIDLIDPGETKTVVFGDFPDVPFGESTTVQVSVKPVPGEKNTENNSAEYPVVFTLGQ